MSRDRGCCAWCRRHRGQHYIFLSRFRKHLLVCWSCYRRLRDCD